MNANILPAILLVIALLLVGNYTDRYTVAALPECNANTHIEYPRPLIVTDAVQCNSFGVVGGGTKQCLVVCAPTYGSNASAITWQWINYFENYWQ